MKRSSRKKLQSRGQRHGNHNGSKYWWSNGSFQVCMTKNAIGLLLWGWPASGRGGGDVPPKKFCPETLTHNNKWHTHTLLKHTRTTNTQTHTFTHMFQHTGLKKRITLRYEPKKALPISLSLFPSLPRAYEFLAGRHLRLNLLDILSPPFS